jgi:hypothetical protein
MEQPLGAYFVAGRRIVLPYDRFLEASYVKECNHAIDGGYGWNPVLSSPSVSPDLRYVDSPEATQSRNHEHFAFFGLWSTIRLSGFR